MCPTFQVDMASRKATVIEEKQVKPKWAECTEEQLQEAMGSVNNGTLSVNKAATVFHIPRRALRNHLENGSTSFECFWDNELLLAYDIKKAFRLNRSTLGPILNQVWARSVTAANIVSVFRTMGMNIFVPHKILDQAFAASAVTEMPQEHGKRKTNTKGTGERKDTAPRLRKMARLDSNHEVQDKRESLDEFGNPSTSGMNGKRKTNTKGTGERKDTAPRLRKMARLDSNHEVQDKRESLDEFGNPSTSGMNVTKDSW
ncbi:hypothetical protein PR048_006026 [Dryococelus australis]|uniref:HTH psq-type domain-containing protein n=1 Tax=Dryococelus australis TaxID=614101 RepID=A0ABQ9I9U4_9NEOP|nr:hypothetical protein PR048_006026 [Dryococelus australis]